VAHGGAGYVAVGGGGTILSSSNGQEWTARTSGIDNGAPVLRGVAYGDKGYVAVGDRGTIVSSADGVVWKRSVSGTLNDLWTVTWCSGQYVATGSLDTPMKSGSNPRRVYLSPDGEKWSAMTMAEGLPFFGAACGGNRTVMLVGRRILQSDPLPEAK